MRIADIVTKSVAFVAYRHSGDATAEDVDLDATAFYVGYPSSVTSSHRFFYFVTAKHSVSGQHGGEQVLVLNTRHGKTLLPVTSKWYVHPTDESVDVAVIPFVPSAEYDIKYISTETFITADYADNYPAGTFGLGSEVCFPGLFTFASGKKRAMPLVRHGNVAMFPDGPIQVYSGFADVYLIEARSIEGLSGSPVFIRPTIESQVTDSAGNRITALAIGDLYCLLGMAGGHYDKDGSINDRDSVNMGISVVVPARRILEVLEHPELVAARTAYDNQIRAAISP